MDNKIIDNNNKLPQNAITNFHADGYMFLSNFYEVEVTYDGLAYGSSEAAYQAQKCMTEEEKILFTGYRSAESKSKGNKVQPRPDWEQVKLGFMEGIVRAKFTQNPELARLLLETGDRMLVEGNKRGDTYWGIDMRTGEGENHLGKILMKVREELNTAN